MAKCPASSVSKAGLNIVLDHVKRLIVQGLHEYEQQSFGILVSSASKSLNSLIPM